MEKGRYIHPDRCQLGRIYYIKISGSNGTTIFNKVTFLAYRPHPAEVLVQDGRGTRVVHRRFLYCRGSGNGKTP